MRYDFPSMHFWRTIRKMSRLQVQILIVLVAFLVALRVALPEIVKWYVNKTLDEMPEYDGRIGDVDMKLWRGAYQIQDIDIIKTDGDVPVPFFSASNVEFSVQWRALFDGALVAEIKFLDPVINFVKGPTEETSQVGVDKPWLDVIKKLFPLDINRFEVSNGEVHYRDFHSSPKVDLEIDRIKALATNLTNSKKLSKTLVATLTSTGRTFGESNYELSAKIDPEPDRATFDLNFDMQPVSLTKLNDFAKAYGNFDFEKGTLEVAIELAANDGRIKGYLKPILDGISVVSLKNDSKNPLQLVWESTMGGILRLTRNQPNNRFATKIPIEGTMKDPKVRVLPTLGNLLKNEFIRAYQSGLENSVDLSDAAGASDPRAAEKARKDIEKAQKEAARAEKKAEKQAEKEAERAEKEREAEKKKAAQGRS